MQMCYYNFPKHECECVYVISMCVMSLCKCMSVSVREKEERVREIVWECECVFEYVSIWMCVYERDIMCVYVWVCE